MSRYTSATDADRAAMLAAIGVDSIEDLFVDIPEGVRLRRPLDIAPGQPEQAVYGRMRSSRRATSPRRTRSRSSAPGCTTTTCPR